MKRDSKNFKEEIIFVDRIEDDKVVFVYNDEEFFLPKELLPEVCAKFNLGWEGGGLAEGE